MDIGRRLKNYREKAGFYQAKDFAEKLEIPYTRYMSYENKGAEPKLDILCKIATLLNISVDELLGQGIFERCKGKVESTHTMKVIENLDGSVEVTFEYDAEIVKKISDMMRSMNINERPGKPLTKPIKKFSSKEEFCHQVEKTNSYFDTDISNMEHWERIFDNVYDQNQYVRCFNEQSIIPLEMWQIKSISSCMLEELTNPANRTPEKIAECQKYLDRHFANYRKVRNNIHRIPPGYDDLLS